MERWGRTFLRVMRLKLQFQHWIFFLMVNLVPNLPEKFCGWLMAAGAKGVTSADDLPLLSVIDMGR